METEVDDKINKTKGKVWVWIIQKARIILSRAATQDAVLPVDTPLDMWTCNGLTKIHIVLFVKRTDRIFKLFIIIYCFISRIND